MAGAAALVAVAFVVMPRVEARLRATVPATDAMRQASGVLDLSATASEAPTEPVDPSSDRERLIAGAYDLVGAPYEWGAKGPRTYDCSGFTKAAYGAVHLRLPDGSFNQAKGELPLRSLDDLVPGDLLFYRWPGATGVKHVTLYLGEGWVIGTGSPRQPREVVVYPLASDFAAAPGTVVTYRHLVMRDGS